MTRWWAYATLALAIVCGSIPSHDGARRTRGESELVEATPASSGAVRKRNSKHKPIVRRDASAPSPVTIVDHGIDIAEPRSVLVDVSRWFVARIEAPAIAPAARGPPRS